MQFYVISKVVPFLHVRLTLYNKWHIKAINYRDGLSNVIWNCSLKMRFYSKAWETHRAIVIEDCLLTCHGYKYYPDEDEGNRCGARYCTAFSDQFPHFEVSNNLKHGAEVSRLWRDDCQLTFHQVTDIQLYIYQHDNKNSNNNNREMCVLSHEVSK